VRFQGITQDRKYVRFGVGEAVEEVNNLRGIDGEEGEAGMKSFPTLRISSLNHTH
jgi:hypothetical protein